MVPLPEPRLPTWVEELGERTTRKPWFIAHNLQEGAGEEGGSICPHYDLMVDVAGLLGVSSDVVQSVEMFCGLKKASSSRHTNYYSVAFCSLLREALPKAIKALEGWIGRDDLEDGLVEAAWSIARGLRSGTFTDGGLESLEVITKYYREGRQISLMVGPELGAAQRHLQKLRDAQKSLAGLGCKQFPKK